AILEAEQTVFRDTHAQCASALSRRQSMPAGAGIDRPFLAVAEGIARDAAAAAAAGIRVASIEQAAGGFLVGRGARGLVRRRTVPPDAEAFQCIQHAAGAAGRFARRVGVVAASQPFALGDARFEITGGGRQETAEM